jgi:hypothetical protein
MCPSANCTTGSPDDGLVTTAIRREREAIAATSVLGYRARMHGLSTNELAKKTGIAPARIEMLERLPEHVSPTESEKAAIKKCLGSGDLFQPLTKDSEMAERIRLA